MNKERLWQELNYFSKFANYKFPTQNAIKVGMSADFNYNDRVFNIPILLSSSVF